MLFSHFSTVPGSLARLSRRIRRRVHSRSVLGMLLFGFMLVVTPLTVGLLISSQQIKEVTGESEQLLKHTMALTQASREMAQRLVAVERAVRQYRVLRDEEARTNLDQQRESFSRRVHALLMMDLEPDQVARLEQVVAREALLAEQALTEAGGVEWPPALAFGFRELDMLAREFTAGVDIAADQALERLERLGAQARTTSFVHLALIVPFAIGLAIVFTGLINRPIRRLDRAIRALARPEVGPVPRVETPRDLRALSVRLEWVRRKLIRTERDRQRLLGQVSHELKTPLSAIREGASLLDEQLFGPLNAKQSEVLAILKQNVTRLQDQIESLLRYNRLRSGMEPARYRNVNLAELADDVIASRSLELTARKIRIGAEIDPKLWVSGDYDMLRTALDNLLSNALKYSAAGGQIGLFSRRDGAGIIIEVADRGPGIKPADRSRLFEPFFRGVAMADGSVPGSGLGLSICRDLVRAHGGEVRLSDRAGWNTTFEIRLPEKSMEHEYV